MKSRPPKKPNHFIGYRTRRSMRNQQTWEFAQKVGGAEMMKWGGILWFLSITSFIVELPKQVETITGVIMVVVIAVLMVVRVERALKDHFGDH